MSNCSLTKTDESKEWPEGIISVKLTMNPYLLVLAEEKAAKAGLKVWEYINVALWEKMGQPSREELTNFAAVFELDDMDPKWKERLKLAARHELEVMEQIKDGEV
ncbi:MAG: hypothetical protein ACLPVO_09520 [Desulfomonilaceae bacterium]